MTVLERVSTNKLNMLNCNGFYMCYTFGEDVKPITQQDHYGTGWLYLDNHFRHDSIGRDSTMKVHMYIYVIYSIYYCNISYIKQYAMLCMLKVHYNNRTNRLRRPIC